MGLEPGSRCSASRSTWSSSAAAPTRASPTCALAASIFEGPQGAGGRARAGGARLAGGQEQAEAEGLDRVFREAGAEWREAGCSMCIAMNGDQLEPGQYAVSTSNRNFEGRQGKGGRTFLASPLTAAAAAVTGGSPIPRTRSWRGHEHNSRASAREWSSLLRDDVDTDQIIPARFLKVDRQGRPGPDLFADWRYDATARQARLRAEPARRRRARRSWWRATTSAAARRASTRRGRSSATASARWSHVSFADIFPQQRAQERPPADRARLPTR